MHVSIAHEPYEQLRPVTRCASVLLAHNPSPMTLEGTNTWLLRAPDVEDCVVDRPRRGRRRHLRAVAATAPSR